MAVTGADVLQYESTDTDSTGGVISGSTITSGIPNNVWDNISDAQRVAGIVVYRKTFWKNQHATDSLLKPTFYASTPPTNAAYVVGLGANLADDNNPAQGNMSAFGAAARAALISDGADTRVVTIYGLDNAGTPVPITEDVVLTGAVEVLSVATFSKVVGFRVPALSASRTVTLKQGTGGTSRGVIGPNEVTSWLWLTATSKGAGLYLPSLPPAQSYAVWRRLTVSAGAGPVRPDTLTMRVEETA